MYCIELLNRVDRLTLDKLQAEYLHDPSQRRGLAPCPRPPLKHVMIELQGLPASLTNDVGRKALGHSIADLLTVISWTVQGGETLRRTA